MEIVYLMSPEDCFRLLVGDKGILSVSSFQDTFIFFYCACLFPFAGLKEELSFRPREEERWRTIISLTSLFKRVLFDSPL